MEKIKPMMEIIICTGLSVLTVIISVVVLFASGAVRLLKLITSVENKLLILNNDLMRHSMELAAESIDLAKRRELLRNKKCNCTE